MGGFKRSGTLAFASGRSEARFDDAGLMAGDVPFHPVIVLRMEAGDIELAPTNTRTTIDDGLLVRVVSEGQSADGHALRVTYDLHPTGNIHVYIRVELGAGVALREVDLPRIAGVREGELVMATGRHAQGEASAVPLTEPWLQLRGAATLGIAITKRPWRARWNDIGATAYTTLGNARVMVDSEGVALRATVGAELAAGETIEAALVLRAFDEPAEALRREAVHDDPRELVYIPAEEWEQFMSRQAEDRWLGPPILGGCANRPADQLVPRTLGMDILAHRRFSWNNEDLSLWRITGKSLYHDFAVKKAYCLLHAQNEYGGWFEGYEFYNLPPRHHQHYHSYTAFVFLIDLYDATGHAPFIEAALRSKEFWLGPPPGNSHSVDAPDAWWYRWGGYINDAGYTDERHALNTHASVLMIFSMLWSRTGDAEARTGLDHGVNAFNRALEIGMQRPDGQFLYSLSQVDPRFELPGDPPYIQAQLIPEIENVYTVLSAFRLLVANRVSGDAAVANAVARALAYFWAGYKNGTAHTYRCYPVKAFGLAAGELDLRFAFALPTLLADPEHWTSIYRGFSAWVAPLGHKGLLVEHPNAAAGMESVFMRRDDRGFTFANVNVGPPATSVPVRVELDAAAAGSRVELVEPADGSTIATLPAVEADGWLEFELPRLTERSVAVTRLVSGR